jgi:hypothetical protein
MTVIVHYLANELDLGGKLDQETITKDSCLTEV